MIRIALIKMPSLFSNIEFPLHNTLKNPLITALNLAIVLWKIPSSMPLESADLKLITVIAWDYSRQIIKIKEEKSLTLTNIINFIIYGIHCCNIVSTSTAMSTICLINKIMSTWNTLKRPSDYFKNARVCWCIKRKCIGWLNIF